MPSLTLRQEHLNGTGKIFFAGMCKCSEVVFILLAYFFNSWLEWWRVVPTGVRLAGAAGSLAVRLHHALRPHLAMLGRSSVKWKVCKTTRFCLAFFNVGDDYWLLSFSKALESCWDQASSVESQCASCPLQAVELPGSAISCNLVETRWWRRIKY